MIFVFLTGVKIISVYRPMHGCGAMIQEEQVVEICVLYVCVLSEELSSPVSQQSDVPTLLGLRLKLGLSYGDYE